MKAIVYEEYGSPDVLKLQEVEKPSPGENEVLVKIHAASINSWDRDLLRGVPFLNRLLAGLLKPKYRILGADIAGHVEAVGGNVEHFQPGDEVFGDLCSCGWGGFAEYVCARENSLIHKPACMTFEEAASIPQGAVMALQSLCEKRRIQSGQTVLINGAGGSVGTFAIQMAKSFGAEVTGVDSTGKLDMMRLIGADHVIDYTQEDFTRNGIRYDLIIENVADRSIFDYRRALSPQGAFVLVGGSMIRIFQTILLGPLISIITGMKMGILAQKPNKDLKLIAELVESGQVIPVIDRLYSLEEVPEAFRYFEEGRFKGKIVITMG